MASEIIGLAASVLEHARFRSLAPAARAVLMEVVIRRKRSGNGRIGYSVREAAARCNIGRDTANAAFRELMAKGFLICVTPGGFHKIKNLSAEWRLTMFKCDVSGEPATNDFLDVRVELKADDIKRIRGANIVADDGRIPVSVRFLN
jgi:hypothetical protein